MKSIIEEYGSFENLPAEHKITILKLKLENTDYKSLQHHEGEITDEEFAPIKEQRKKWRAEINRLEEELKNGN